MTEANPFVLQIDRFVEDVIVLARDDRLRELVSALPQDESGRVEAIRATITTDELSRLGVSLPEGLRIVPRWFEEREAVTNAERYLPEKYVDGYPPGNPGPKPMPPKPSPITTCGSVGVVVCVSVGG